MVVDPVNETTIPETVRMRARRGQDKMWIAQPASAVVRTHLPEHMRSAVTSLRLSLSLPCTRPGGMVE